MKKTLLALALLAALGANAQTTSSDSGSNSGASANAGNGAVAVGNLDSSRSTSASLSGATSGSMSGALGNTVTLNQNVPSTQTINQNMSGSTSSNSTSTSTNNMNMAGTTTSNENVRYSGAIDNHTSGGTYNVSTDNVNYSGTQTLKNVPAIAMSGPASGPCTGNSGGLGLAGPGWGLGLNGSAVMVDCRLRENLRVIGMAMQSLDGVANPQEKGEITVMFMDDVRALHQYNQKIAGEELGKK